MKRWFALTTQFTSDSKVQQLGESRGPGGPLAIVVLLGQAKIQNAGGQVEGTFRSLAHDAFLANRREAQQIVESATRFGLLEMESTDEHGFVVRFPRWRRYQEAARKEEDARKRAQTRANARSRPKSSSTGTTTETPTTTEDEQELFETPSSLTSLTATLNRVVEGKRARPLKARAAVKACRDFGDRDLAVEVDKFAHYWLDGAGENRPLRDAAGAWRNWLRRAPRAAAMASRNGRPTSRTDADVARFGELAERLREEEAAA